MGQRLTRVEREMRRLNKDPLEGPRQTVDFWSLNGVKQHDHWTPPAPHARQEVSLGADVQRDRMVKADNRTTAQVIADMVRGK